MPVLTRSALEASPLADLHVIASELGLDGYRRLRKADLVAAIVERQGGAEEEPEAPEAEAPETPEAEAPETPEAEAPETTEEEAPRRRRGARGGRGRRRDADPDAEADEEPAAEAEAEAEADEQEEERPAPRRRTRRSRSAAALEEQEDAEEMPTADGWVPSPGEEDEVDVDVDVEVEPEADAEPEERPSRRRGRRRDEGEERVVEGVVELVANGSGFVRVPGSDEDVYISAAQVRRCELVAGDAVSGPVRDPRRSERYPSLVRIDTINGRPADEVAEGTHFDDLPCALPTERLALDSEDPTLKAIEWLTPLGRGSRATIVGAEHAGKTEALRRLAAALAAAGGLDVHVVLSGVRPEELAPEGIPAPVAAVSAAASADAQLQSVERAVDTAKRVAARGGHVVVLIDSLGGLPAGAARRLLAAARSIVDGGSLTIIATAPEAVGGETTVIALDRNLTRTGRFPALDLVASGTLRPELLVGEAGAQAIADARAEALD